MAQLTTAASRTLDIVGCQIQAVASLQRMNMFQMTRSPVLATRNAVQRISGWKHKRKCFTRISATAEANEEEVTENVTKSTTLKQLDQQLASLADREDSSASRPSLGASTQQVRPVKRQPGELPVGENGQVQWPDFSPGFLGFLGFAMLLLTVINNVLYRTFLGPPVVAYRPGDPVQSSADDGRGYRIRSRSEEREEKAAEITRNLAVIESREAPPLISE